MALLSVSFVKLVERLFGVVRVFFTFLGNNAQNVRHKVCRFI